MGFREMEQRARAEIAQNIEDDLLALMYHRLGPYKPRRWSLRHKIKHGKPTAHITAVLASAITLPDYDLHRTDKMRFYSGTTARIEAQ